MNKLTTPLALLAGLVLLQCGCVNHGATMVTGLRVELTGIERAADGTASVAWRVVNPNVASYLLGEVSNKIYLNGNLVGTTFMNDPLGIPPQGSAAKSNKLIPAGSATDRILSEAAGHGTANYSVESRLVIQVYGDQTEKGNIVNSGSVTVVNK